MDKKAKDTKRAEDHTREDINKLAREKTRKETYFAKEKAAAKAQEARKLKEKRETL